MEQIVEIQLRYLKQRLKDRNFDVEFTEAAKKQLMDEGYDPAFGARPLEARYPTADWKTHWPTLKSSRANFSEGDRIRIDADSHTFKFEKIGILDVFLAGQAAISIEYPYALFMSG